MGAGAQTATFLLTDVEGSTRAWQERPRETSEAFERLEAITRDVVASHNGEVLKARGEGDSAFCVFASASDAIAAAVDLQRALLASPLRVRVGVHTGEAEHRKDEWYGIAPGRCARIRGLAAGGQILCSHVTAQMATRLADDVSLRDLGRVKLPSFTHPETVFQACHPSLLDDFPPLRRGATNVPASFSSFVGRETEIAELRGLIERSRLVTLTGSGGCGKSRLALETLRGVDRPGGVWFVDLAPLADPELAARSAAAALGLTVQTADALIERLRFDPVVLLFDNCEHVIDGVARLAVTLLESCPEVALVATSREPLGITGEVVWRVSSLSAPSVNEEATLDHHAIRLFVERAEAARPGFLLTHANAGAIGEICRRLDGIPLAIELAAARTALMGPEQIARGLDDRFQLLTSGGRTALSRQRTLEASVDWSYEMLSEPERIALRRLAVFVGTFSLEGAEPVCAVEDALDTVGRLVHRSLVTYDEKARVPRYRLLDTIRHYAQRKVIEAGELDETLARHTAYYSALAASRWKSFVEGNASFALESEADIDNFRVAFDYALAHGDAGAVLDIASMLLLLLNVFGPLDEYRERSRIVLRDVEGGLMHGPAAALGHLVLANCLLANFFEAFGLCFEFPPEELNVDDVWWRVFTLGNAGMMLFCAGQQERGRALMNEARCAQHHEYLWAMTGLAIGAFAEHMAGDLAAAAVAADEAVEAFRSLRADAWGSAFAESEAAWLALSACDLERAHAGALAGLALDERDVFTMPLLEAAVATVDLIRGEIGESRLHADAATRWARVGGTQTFASGLVAFFRVRLALWQGDVAEAAAVVPAAIAGVGEGVNGFDPATILDAVEASLASGDVQVVEQYVQKMELMGNVFGQVRHGSNGKLARARLARALGDPVAAAEFARAAIEGLLSIHAWLDLIEALELYGGAIGASGDPERAARLMGAAHSARGRMGAVTPPAHVRPLLHADAEPLRDSPEWTEGATMSIEEAANYALRGRGRRRTASFGWGALTPAELDVARLASEGLTNKEIGEKLFVSPRTVQNHLSKTFAKLGLKTRAELAAEAARHGL